MKNNRKGFTLVELIVVIAVIAILAGIIIGTFASVLKRAKDSADVQNIKNAEIAQKADDIIKKIEDSNWFGWEDFEAKIVEKITTVVKANSSSFDSNALKSVVQDVVTTALANIEISNTDLTADQVEAIVANALGTLKYEGVTEAQVRAIVNAATNTLVGTQLSVAQVRSIITVANENKLTAAQVAEIVGRANFSTPNDVQAAVTTITTALTNTTSGLATSAQAEEIKGLIEQATATIKSGELNDVILAKGLNIKLDKSNKEIETPSDVVAALDQPNPVYGVSADNIVLLDLTNEAFVVVKDEDGYPIVYSPNIAAGTLLGDTYKYWTFVEPASSFSEFSVYLLGDTSVETITLNGVGLDVGNADVRNVVYNGSSGGHTVVIRTNSNLTTLTVDAPNDIVYHYDSVGSVNIISSDMASYHENGTVSFLEVAGGHIVLEETAKVSAVHFTATGTGEAAKFENEDGKKISIDLSKVSEENMPSFTRDAITIKENGTYVAEVTTNKTEFVWLFGNGIKEQMVTTEQAGTIAENGTLKTGITAGADDGSVAEQIANPAKRNSEGVLVDNNGDEIDVSSVNWSNSDALETVTDIVYKALKTKEDAINENVIEYITTFEQLKDFVENGTKLNGVIGANIDITANIVVDRKVSLDLNGFALNNLVGENRSFACMDECELLINGQKEGSKIIIPSSNMSSYGFFDMKEGGASVVLDGGEYVGNTDNGALFKVRYPRVNIEIYDSEINTSGGGVINSVGSSMYGYIDEDGYRRSFAYTTVTVVNTSVVHGYANDEVGNHLDIATFNIIGNAYFEDVTISTAHGSGIDLNGGTNYVKNCNVTVLKKTNNTSNWTGTALSCANDADVIVEGGTFTGSFYGAYVYTSNGRFTFKGDVTISGETAALKVGTATSKAPSSGYRTPGITVESGNIIGDLSRGTDTNISITGGTFTVDPTEYVDVENYNVVGEGPYTVSSK